MGTRADFYVGRGVSAEWLGSIAYDGYPPGVPKAVRACSAESDYRKAVAKFLAGEESATLPASGWPWPWKDSGTTDYAYAFDGASVYVSRFGGNWFGAMFPEPEDASGSFRKAAVFPDMSDRQSVAEAGTTRSGVMVVKF